MSFARAVANGDIRVIDLTQTLSQEFPTIVLPPEFGQCAPFRMEEVSRYDERGPAWYWNNIIWASIPERTSTRRSTGFPARICPTMPSIRSSRAVHRAGAVIDCSKECAADADFALTVPFVGNGRRSTAGSSREVGCCCAPTGRRRTYPDYAGLRDDGAHTPGPEPAVVKWLVEERDVHGFGTETIGTDFGQAQHFNPPYPAHFYMHGKGRFGLQCLTNLDLLPPKGAVIIAAPLKIKQGSGSPLRVLALVPGGGA